MNENDVKPWYASRAVWGGVVAMLGGIAGMLGYAVAPEDQETVAGLLTALGSTIGGLVAVAGRISATRRIGTPVDTSDSAGA